MSTTRPSALVAGILAMLLVATVAVPTAAADPEQKYRFTGYGTDHGVGLSQRGAAGRAKAGQTYDQILLHYFSNVRLNTTLRHRCQGHHHPGTGHQELPGGHRQDDPRPGRQHLRQARQGRGLPRAREVALDVRYAGRRRPDLPVLVQARAHRPRRQRCLGPGGPGLPRRGQAPRHRRGRPLDRTTHHHRHRTRPPAPEHPAQHQVRPLRGRAAFRADRRRASVSSTSCPSSRSCGR